MHVLYVWAHAYRWVHVNMYMEAKADIGYLPGPLCVCCFLSKQSLSLKLRVGKFHLIQLALGILTLLLSVGVHGLQVVTTSARFLLSFQKPELCSSCLYQKSFIHLF